MSELPGRDIIDVLIPQPERNRLAKKLSARLFKEVPEISSLHVVSHRSDPSYDTKVLAVFSGSNGNIIQTRSLLRTVGILSDVAKTKDQKQLLGFEIRSSGEFEEMKGGEASLNISVNTVWEREENLHATNLPASDF